MPKSPRMRPPAHLPYLTIQGSLTPYCSSSAAICSTETVLPMARNRSISASTADPGASSMMKNVSSDTRNNVITA